MAEHHPDTHHVMRLPLPGSGFAEFEDSPDGQLPGLFMSKFCDDESQAYCGGEDEWEDRAATGAA